MGGWSVYQTTVLSRKHNEGMNASLRDGLEQSERQRWVCGRPFAFQVGSERCDQLAGALDVEVKTRPLTWETGCEELGKNSNFVLQILGLV